MPTIFLKTVQQPHDFVDVTRSCWYVSDDDKWCQVRTSPYSGYTEENVIFEFYF